MMTRYQLRWIVSGGSTKPGDEKLRSAFREFQTFPIKIVLSRFDERIVALNLFITMIAAAEGAPPRLIID